MSPGYRVRLTPQALSDLEAARFHSAGFTAKRGGDDRPHPGRHRSARGLLEPDGGGAAVILSEASGAFAAGEAVRDLLSRDRRGTHRRHPPHPPRGAPAAGKSWLIGRERKKSRSVNPSPQSTSASTPT